MYLNKRASTASARSAAIPSGLLALIASTALWAATTAPKSTVELWSGPDQWIRIEPQDQPAAPNDHPVQLTTDQVSNALAALRLVIVDKDSGTQTERAVFTRPELETLAPQVVAGLARASSTQDVTFSTIGSHALSAGGLIKDPGVNAGRVFYKDGKLNVIFGELQSNYRKKNYYGQRSEDFTPRRPGSRTKESKQKFGFAVAPGIELQAANGGAARNDWVVIDTAVAASQAVAAQESATSAPRQAAAPATTTAAPAAANANTAAASSGAPAAAAAAAPAAAGAAASGSGKSADIEQRLQKLKELRDKGLISEEAYNSKVKELLSEL